VVGALGDGEADRGGAEPRRAAAKGGPEERQME
jgi:hypothetical protein